MPRSRLPLPNLPLSLTVLSWAYNFVALKQLYHQMTAPAVSLVRFALMYVVLIALCLAQGQSLRLPKEHATRILVGGALSMGVYMVFFLEGMTGTSASEGAIILAIAPVLTYLFACVVKQERFVPIALLGAILAFVGVAVVVAGTGSHGHGTLRGDLMVLGSAVVWAISVVYMRPALEGVAPLRALTLSMPAALVVLIPYGIRGVATTDLTAITPYCWLMMGHIAIFSGVLGFACFYAGIRQVGASGATLYQFLVPPTTVLFAWMTFGQPLTLAEALGLAIVIAGVATASYGRRVAARQVALMQASEGATP